MDSNALQRKEYALKSNVLRVFQQTIRYCPEGEITRFSWWFKAYIGTSIYLTMIRTALGSFYQDPKDFIPGKFHEFMKLNPDLNTTDDEGYTALHWTTLEDQRMATALLLYYGASQDVLTKVNRDRPINKAKASQMKKIYDDIKNMSKRDFAARYQLAVPSKQVEQIRSQEKIEGFPYLELPAEIQYEILNYLPIDGLFIAQFVCKDWFEYKPFKKNKRTSFLGKWLPNSSEDSPLWRVKFTIMATPTVYHYCIATNLSYSKPHPFDLQFTVFYDGFEARLGEVAKDHKISSAFDAKSLRNFIFDSKKEDLVYYLKDPSGRDHYAFYIQKGDFFGLGIELWIEKEE